MGKQRLVPTSKEKLRNLKQYRDMDDEEFDDIFEEIQIKALQIELNEEEYEAEIEKRRLEFADDYDLTDMKINDRSILRQLIQAMISLESLEKTFLILRHEISPDNVLLLDRVAGVMNKLRSDISNMQDDLKLTRKIRKESQEESFMEWLANIKAKAIEFHKEKSLYVFCLKCNRLLATIWLLYPDSKNKISLHCSHCGNIQEESLGELYKTRNRNSPDTSLGI